MSARLTPAAGAILSAFALSWAASWVIRWSRSASSFARSARTFLILSRTVRSSVSAAL
jgi:hypothetical protein